MKVPEWPYEWKISYSPEEFYNRIAFLIDILTDEQFQQYCDVFGEEDDDEIDLAKEPKK